ncbi:EspA/EspE family type VII secretion system effector [Mycobacterium marinum]|uniref:EspA/EspE family type VII secretion system effector n=1 Tax=Mycobacterium marinum TaxID=1781 RepID=UPI00235926C0|nr:EspA/EspE family type VII secretion system effector [Mycobacterium marinum]MDC8985581.1 EspA/EspE family type VII secretion system effector [Mycobacterium marinum]MDC9002870.1 EspA/EspE family type VII secretion system effector [Mycobacterium marinum]MDC9013607.1 EspA/EspE family type VII secretion system effector [Mycobacterium marinum]MDC9018968.1 EspA/EspE family type VII secretion system effector [Mycobacterium marinum]
MFAEVGAQIASLDPEGLWQGTAERAYSAQKLAQSQHAALIADLDRLAAELVSSQSEAVQDARDFIYGEIGFVLFVFAVCIYLELQGPEGQLASIQFAIPLCILMLFFAAFRLVLLQVTTSQNASDMQALAQQLTDISASAPTCCENINGPPELGLATAVSLSEFTLDGRPWPIGHTLDLGSALAELPGVPECALASGAVFGLSDFGTPHLLIPLLPGVPSLPDTTNLPEVSDQAMCPVCWPVCRRSHSYSPRWASSAAWPGPPTRSASWPTPPPSTHR